MASIDSFRNIYGDGSVIISIKKEHIDKVFEAIGDCTPDKMVVMPDGGFVLLWEDVYFEYKLTKWYTNLVDLLDSIEKEFDDEQFSIETAMWNTWGGLSIEFNHRGALGGFGPIVTYTMYGMFVDPEQFAKKK